MCDIFGKNAFVLIAPPAGHSWCERFRGQSIHPLSVTALSLLWGFCWSKDARPSLMAEDAMQGAHGTSGTIWDSVSCSRSLQHAVQLSQEQGFEPATFHSLATH